MSCETFKSCGTLMSCGALTPCGALMSSRILPSSSAIVPCGVLPSSKVLMSCGALTSSVLIFELLMDVFNIGGRAPMLLIEEFDDLKRSLPLESSGVLTSLDDILSCGALMPYGALACTSAEACDNEARYIPVKEPFGGFGTTLSRWASLRRDETTFSGNESFRMAFV